MVDISKSLSQLWNLDNDGIRVVRYVVGLGTTGIAVLITLYTASQRATAIYPATLDILTSLGGLRNKLPVKCRLDILEANEAPSVGTFKRLRALVGFRTVGIDVPQRGLMGRNSNASPGQWVCS